MCPVRPMASSLALAPLQSTAQLQAMARVAAEPAPTSRVRVVLEDDDQDEDDELVAWLRTQAGGAA